MTTCLKRTIFVAAVLLCLGSETRGDEFKVIANTSVAATAVSTAELKGVFLSTKTALNDGSRVEPVLEKGGPAHESFLRECLGKTDAALRTYYRSLVFTGKGGMPRLLANDEEVIEYVAKNKGAIGYVSPRAAIAGVKVLEIR